MNTRPLFGSVSPLPPERVECEGCHRVLTDPDERSMEVCPACWQEWAEGEMLRHPVATPEHDRWLSDACVLALAWDTLAYRLGPEHSTLDMMRQIEASHGLADPLRRARAEGL